MSDLLTAKDIEQRIFKKVSFGGYAVPDVEEFLGQVAEDLDAYALCISEGQSRVSELEEALKKYESMEATIKDALILAQKSAQEKREEAEHQAALIVAEAERKRNEIDDQVRLRIDEANRSADGIVAAAHASVAQITQEAEKMRDEAQKRFEGMDQEIEQRLAEANNRVGQITANARLEARRMLGKTQSEIEESERAMSALRSEKEHFLREFGDLLSKFGDMLEKARSDSANEAPAGKPEENPKPEGAAETEGTAGEGEKGEGLPLALADDSHDKAADKETKDEAVIF
jgi:cell division initiation protein